MIQKTGSVEDKSDDGGDKFIDVADMSEKRERAKTPTTMQRERVHEAFVVQEDADQESHNDHVAAASQDKGDGTAKIVGRQTIPRKPPDAECQNLKKIVPVMLKTGFMLI